MRQALPDMRGTESEHLTSHLCRRDSDITQTVGPCLDEAQVLQTSEMGVSGGPVELHGGRGQGRTSLGKGQLSREMAV